MTNLDINWENGIYDRTGYLFSFAKSLGTAVKNSPFKEVAEDIIATSGFAFRMWVAEDLCPSATSIWSFDEQKRWVENGGLLCNYVGRYWGQDYIEEERRLQALSLIKKSIDNGIPAVSWDIGVPEWGLITGYDDKAQLVKVLDVSGKKGEMAYNLLGKRELPVLSVLTITGKSQKLQDTILIDTLKLAVYHLSGQEWCDNAQGLQAYPAFIKHFDDNSNPNEWSWNMEYYLGTYGGLKYYAYRYIEKTNLTDLAELYKDIYDLWQKAFDLKKGVCLDISKARTEIAKLLKTAYDKELKAFELMQKMI
ncbi:MAG: hypothetical protein PHI65_05090 [Firmicutes bacterium]|nr:hypothetical protein [Bacillota bacterium]